MTENLEELVKRDRALLMHFLRHYTQITCTPHRAAMTSSKASMRCLRFNFMYRDSGTGKLLNRRLWVDLPESKWVERLAKVDGILAFLWIVRERVSYLGLVEGDAFDSVFGVLDGTYYVSNKKFRDVERKTGWEPRKVLELWHADQAIMEEYTVAKVGNIMTAL